MELINITGVTNPVINSTLSTAQTFTLDSNKNTLTIVNTSSTESANILIKGARVSLHIPNYGDVDITDGLTFTITTLKIAIVNLPNISKHIGEVGDLITISSDSTESGRVLFWIDWLLLNFGQIR